MPVNNAAFVGEVPQNYDRHLGSVLFDPYAKDLASRVKVPDGASVLELACGTGIATRRLRDQLAPGVKLVATDLNEAMMNYAAQKFEAKENVEWKQADGTALPFADQSFDAVVCQFGLMFFPDKPAGAAEVFRVLKPGGIFVFNVWDDIEQNDLARAAQATILKFFPENPPDFYEVPFSFHDQQAIKSLLLGAGFREIELLVLPQTSVSPAARDVAHGLIHGNPVIASINERDASKGPEVESSLAALIASQFGDSPVKARMQAIVCTAVR